MRTVLIVSPHFPPINAADMQRVRMSLPYFAESGWKPVVLAVDPAYVEGVVEPLLLETIPSDVPIRRVSALPVYWTRKVGVGDLGLRAFPFLYWAGAKIIKQYNVNLIYVSTTMFPTMALGRIWKAQFNVPYVLDMQDPWVSDYYEDKPRSERPPKYWLAQHMHRLLEPWTMQQVGGIIAVSETFPEILRGRYPWIPENLCRTIPFGAASLDYEVAARLNDENPYFRRGDGLVHGVYAGVLGKVMKQTCLAICLALKKGLQQYPDLFSKLRLHFIGTDYAMDARATATIRPMAANMGLGEFVEENPRRAPYLMVLNLLRKADFLLVPGPDTHYYAASKIYPYILAQKPLLAILHEESGPVRVLRSTRAGEVVTFSSSSDIKDMASALLSKWVKLLRSLPYEPSTNWDAFEPYTAREMTRRQCELFDHVIGTRFSSPQSISRVLPIHAAFGCCKSLI